MGPQQDGIQAPAGSRSAWRIVRDKRGAMAMIVALSTPMLVAGAGFATDSIQWMLAKRLMQRQADTAALAGAYALAQGASVNSTATNALSRNPGVIQAGTPVIESPPSAGAEAGNNRAVRVALNASMALPFSQFVLDAPVTILAEGTASVVANGQYCALSLENTNTTGIDFQGNPTVNMGCGMATNSPSSSAVSAGGSASVTATPIAAVGYVAPSGVYKGATTLISYSVPQQDPFSALANPTVPNGNASNGNVQPNRTVTLNPGHYNGMDLKGTVTLNPGTYIIDGGSFKANSGAVINGTGVTIILTSKTAANNPSSIASVDINGNARINITAPDSGTYKGVLFYQDRRAPMRTEKINGGSTSKLQGALYFPSTELEFTGNSGLNINCLQMVARKLKWRGNSNITNVCPVGSGSSSFTGTAVRLVG